MLTFWSLVLVWNFGQNPKTDKPGEPAAKTTAPATSPDAKKADQKGDAKKAEAPKEPDSEADKFVRAQAEKLDKLTSVSAEVIYTTRNQDQLIQQRGAYKTGPNNRMRVELAFGEGAAGGKRIYVCDGSSAYTIEEFGDLKRAMLIKIDRIKPLLDDKNMTDNDRNTMWNGMVPYQKPGAMLRAFLDSITFTEKKDDKLGERDVVRLEGRWRKNAVTLLAGGDESKTIDDIDARVPRFMSLVLDKQTGWPLQIEMFQRIASVGVVKPLISIKFSKLVIGQSTPEAEFKFTPPSTMAVQDMTPVMESGLKRMIDQNAAQKAAQKDKPAAPPTPPAAGEQKKQP